MFADLYSESTDRALRSRAQTGVPGQKPAPGVLAGVASAIPSGLAAGGLEVLRAGIRVIDSWTDAMVYQGTGTYLGRTITDEELQAEPDLGKAAGRLAKSLEPTPETAGTAAQVLHGFAKFGGKAAGYALTFGPAGPVMFGVDEAVNEDARLAEQGVDAETRAKAAAVHGLASAAGAALPLTGKSVAQTVGLAMAGGPVLYSTEMAGIRSILENADYQTIAAGYDPFDPVGLLVSTAAPLAFGGAAHLARARAKPKAPEPTPQPVADAARVELAAQRDRVLSGGDPTDARAQAEHRRGVAEAEQRISNPPREAVRPDSEPARMASPDQVASDVVAKVTDAMGKRQAPAEVIAAVEQHVGRALDAAPVMRAVVDRVAESTGLAVESAPARDVGAALETVGTTAEVRAVADSVLTAETVVRSADEIPDAVRAVADAARADPSVATVQVETRDGAPVVTMRDGDGTAMAVRFVADPERAAAAAQPRKPPAAGEPQDQSPRPAQRPQDATQPQDGPTQGQPSESPPAPAQRGQGAKSEQPAGAQTARATPASPDALLEAARGGDDPATGALADDGITDAAVADIVAEAPDMMVMMDDGTTMTAAEALAEADAALAQAQTDSKAFDAAISCFLRTGG